MSQIYDENTLKDMRKSPDKTLRRNKYKVGEFTFHQFYDHSTDIYNPFKVYVYNKEGSYIYGGSGPTIEASYHNLIKSAIEYSEQYKNERNKLINKVGQALAVFREDIKENLGDYED
jgi:hypothetical protein